MTPKLARAGPKIFDKVKAFEERRSSVDLPRRAASFDLDDGGKATGSTNKDEGRALQKRAAFQHRTSSLEDKTSLSQRVQSYQSKFAEELQRIKKLVGKPSLKKAYSTEHVSQRDRLSAGKVEPLPPQVVRKLEARERALEGERVGGREDERTSESSTQAQDEGWGNQRSKPAKDWTAQKAEGSLQRSAGKMSVPMETAAVHQLPGQPATRKSLIRFEDLLIILNFFKTEKSK